MKLTASMRRVNVFLRVSTLKCTMMPFSKARLYPNLLFGYLALNVAHINMYATDTDTWR